MAKLSQINLQFHAVEDRLLLSIKTHELTEYRFWLTRRLVRLMWAGLLERMSRNDVVQAQPDVEARDTVLSFQHEEAVRHSDFETAYSREVRSTPLGSTPVLLAKVHLESRGEETLLGLHAGRGQGIALVLTNVLLHSFSKLLSDAVVKAGWELGLGVGAGTSRQRGGSKRVN